MNARQQLSVACVTLLLSTVLSPALCLPAEGRPQVARKFAEKPNNLKKVSIDRNDLDDLSTNSIQSLASLSMLLSNGENSDHWQSTVINKDSGFSWSNILATIMQMLFTPGAQVGPNKSDMLDADQGVSASPWANIISMGFKILTAIFGGGGLMTGGDGIDKVDNASPLQGVLAAILSAMLGAKDPDQVASMAKHAGEFITTVVTLVDALKTSFSHRSLAARSIGKKDSVSEAATASLTMIKSYIRSFNSSDERCLQQYLCEANRECIHDLPTSNTLYCQLGTYATSFLMERTSSGTFESFQEAGRRGRSGDDCRQYYLECNNV